MHICPLEIVAVLSVIQTIVPYTMAWWNLNAAPLLKKNKLHD
jgi:hypothetical protein